MNLSIYKTLVFDCDGVILNSNKVKTQAFYHAALPYGHQAAQALTDYHVKHGGISRYKKFEYFLSNILDTDKNISTIDNLLDSFSTEVKKGLLRCEIATGLQALRERTSRDRWFVVSGGDQDELRFVFEKRGLSELFDGGVFGSPDTKDEILARELSNGNIQNPALFLGDSKYDYQAANRAGLEFVFLSSWSEVVGWQEWVSKVGLTHAHSVKHLLEG